MFDAIKGIFGKKPEGMNSAPLVGDHGTGGSYFRMLLPQTKRDFEREIGGKVHLNTLVALAVDRFGNSFAESPLIIRERSTKPDGKPGWKILEEHDLQRVAQNPNPEYSWSTLSSGIATSWMLTGNCYLLLWPDKIGRLSQMFWLPHHLVEIMDDGETQDGSKLVTHYRYYVPGHGHIDFDPSYICHLKRGIDPLDMRYGISPLKAALREVFGDNVASTYTSAVLDNLGVPPAIVSFTGSSSKPDLKMTKEFAESFKRSYSGDDAGRVGFLPAEVKVEKVAFSPKDLRVDELSDRLTSRICAACGYDPMALGLPSANKTYSNLAEALDASYTNIVKPAKRHVAEQLTARILRQVYKEEKTQVWWDFSEVAALQDDIDALYLRVLAAWEKGFLTEAEGREMLGLASKPEHDRYQYEVVGSGAALPQNLVADDQKSFGDVLRSKIARRASNQTQ